MDTIESVDAVDRTDAADVKEDATDSEDGMGAVDAMDAGALDGLESGPRQRTSSLFKFQFKTELISKLSFSRVAFESTLGPLLFGIYC